MPVSPFCLIAGLLKNVLVFHNTVPISIRSYWKSRLELKSVLSIHECDYHSIERRWYVIITTTVTDTLWRAWWWRNIPAWMGDVHISVLDQFRDWLAFREAALKAEKFWPIQYFHQRIDNGNNSYMKLILLLIHARKGGSYCSGVKFVPAVVVCACFNPFPIGWHVNTIVTVRRIKRVMSSTLPIYI